MYVEMLALEWERMLLGCILWRCRWLGQPGGCGKGWLAGVNARGGLVLMRLKWDCVGLDVHTCIARNTYSTQAEASWR